MNTKTPRCMFVTRVKALILQICMPVHIFPYMSLPTEIPHRVKLNLPTCSFGQDQSHPKHCARPRYCCPLSLGSGIKFMGFRCQGTQHCLFRRESSLQRTARQKNPKILCMLMHIILQAAAVTAHPPRRWPGRGTPPAQGQWPEDAAALWEGRSCH